MARYPKSRIGSLAEPLFSRPLLVGLAMLVLSSCGGGGGSAGAPALLDVTTTQNSLPANTTATVRGAFTFSDPEGDLGGGSFNYTYAGVSYSISLPSTLTGVANASVSFDLVVSLNSSIGPVTISCWLVDSAGHSSNSLQIGITQVWTRQFGTALEDLGNSIATDNADNILIAGSTFGDLDGESNPGSRSVFIAKYAPDASRAWTRVFGSSSVDSGAGVASDSAGNIYVTGDTVGTSFDGEAGNGLQNGFLTKFDGSGNRQWTRLFGATTSVQVRAIAVNDDGHIYVGGTARGTLNGEVTLGSGDAFLIKFDGDGTVLWTRLLSTVFSDDAYGVTVDGAGNAYVAGGTAGVLGADPLQGAIDAFVAKYDANGALSWVRQFGTLCTEWIKGIAHGPGDRVYVGGKVLQCAFAGNAASGLHDAFVASLDGNGTLQWVRQFGTAWYDSANGVTTDSLGNCYVTGFLDSTTFNADSEGNFIFLAKYDAAGNRAWLDQQRTTIWPGNQGMAAVTDSEDNVFVTGMTHGAFAGYENANPGEDDAFILSFASSGAQR
jgi:hypothetical protein